MNAITNNAGLTPRPYQEQGIEFLRKKKRALLTDQPGMGKTLQAMLAAKKPVLIACPTYLTEQWYEALIQQFPDDEIILADGYRVDREAKLQIPSDWYIINIEMMRSYWLPPALTFIIDESHHVKSHRSQQATAAHKYAKNVPYVFLLTATPITKTPDDLFMQLSIIDPKRFRSYNQFVADYCKFTSGPWGLQVIGVRDAVALKMLLDEYALGRAYKDVGLQLPQLISQKIGVPMPKGALKLYEQVRDQYRLQDIPLTSAGEVLRTLRQITVLKEKMDVAKQVISDNGKPALIFCWYRETAYIVGRELRALVITGDMPAPERRIAAQNADCNVVATMASLSEGVDLSNFRQVIFFEDDYTPGIEYQALSRVRRHSSNNDPILEYRVFMKDTIDEVIMKCVDRRVSDVRQILREALR